MAGSERIVGREVGTTTRGAALIEFDVDGTRGTLTVIDPIERQRDVFGVEAPAALRAATRVSPSSIPAPVDAGLSFAPEAIDCHRVATIHVRDCDWNSLGHVAEAADRTFESGSYLLEVSGPIKLYLQVDGAFAIRADETSSRLRFEEGTRVVLAGRSRHSRPSGTITVPDEPEALMRALSRFGGALKTTSPERSWPTLRGHPPAIRTGDTLSIPPSVPAPETGLRVVVPPTYDTVYPVASLAYYLGAEVVPGSPPRVEASTGDGTVVHRLWTTADGADVTGPGSLPSSSVSPGSVDWTAPSVEARRAFELAVERTLKRAHFVEVLVRDEGLYDVPLHERKAVRGPLEDALAVDPATLYDLDPADRFPHYFALDYRWVEDYAPSWEVASYLPPEPSQAELLPYLVDDLGFVRTRNPETPMLDEDAATGDDDDYGQEVRDQLETLDDFVRDSSPGGTTTPAEEHSTVALGAHDDVLRAGWGGPGYPYAGTKYSRAAFEQRVNREPTTPPIEVIVVCNDPGMSDELSTVDGTYGDDTTLPFEVTVRRECTVEELADLLERGADLFHYIGHADDEGLECADGWFDVRSHPASIDVETFLLNACRSYAQGTALLEAGAIAGIVTHKEVTNSSATVAGRALARLLNAGYPLRVAADVVSDVCVGWQNYAIVGAGGHAIAQRDTGNAPNYHVRTVPGCDDRYEISGETWPLPSNGPGLITKLYLEGTDHFLVGGEIPSVETDRAGLERFLASGQYALRIGYEDTLFWNTDVSLEDIEERA